jgi:hypothetical protein
MMSVAASTGDAMVSAAAAAAIRKNPKAGFTMKSF